MCKSSASCCPFSPEYCRNERPSESECQKLWLIHAAYILCQKYQRYPQEWMVSVNAHRSAPRTTSPLPGRCDLQPTVLQRRRLDSRCVCRVITGTDAMTRRAYPEYHKALMEKATYPSALRNVKFEETRRSFLYRTGDSVYKIRKTNTVYASLAIKERYALEALRLGQRWAPDVVQGVVPIVRNDAGFALGGPGEPLEYALKMAQVSDHYWLHRVVENGKFSQLAVGRLARYLAEHHAAAALENLADEAGRIDNFRALYEEVHYQSRKYVSETLSESMLELVALPLKHFLEDARKVFSRRQKRGRVVDGHGEFIPEHIHLKGTEIFAIAPLDGQRKFRVLDAAFDVACCCNGLRLLGATEASALFLKRYSAAAKDRDLLKVLPAYQTLAALRQGLLDSEALAEAPEGHPGREQLKASASSHYQLAVQTAREISRDL